MSELTAAEAKSYPWMQYDLKKANTMVFYMKIAFNPMGKIKGKYIPLFRAMRALAQLRYDLNFFAIPFEEIAYKKLKNAELVQVGKTGGQ